MANRGARLHQVHDKAVHPAGRQAEQVGITTDTLLPTDASMHQLTSLFEAMQDEARAVELVSFRVALVAMVLDELWPAELVDAVDDLATGIMLLRREELSRAVRAAEAAGTFQLGTEPTLSDLCDATRASDGQQLRFRGAALEDSVRGLVQLGDTVASRLDRRVEASRRGSHLSVVLSGEEQHDRLGQLLHDLVPQSLVAFID